MEKTLLVSTVVTSQTGFWPTPLYKNTLNLSCCHLATRSNSSLHGFSMWLRSGDSRILICSFLVFSLLPRGYVLDPCHVGRLTFSFLVDWRRLSSKILQLMALPFCLSVWWSLPVHLSRQTTKNDVFSTSVLYCVNGVLLVILSMGQWAEFYLSILSNLLNKELFKKHQSTKTQHNKSATTIIIIIVMNTSLSFQVKSQGKKLSSKLCFKNR